jgi:hypothetical protein
MKHLSIMFAAAAALAATVGIVIPVEASQVNAERIVKSVVSGVGDFDFLVWVWGVLNRRL